MMLQLIAVLLVVYVPFFNTLLGTRPLEFSDLVIPIIWACVIFLYGEIRAYYFVRLNVTVHKNDKNFNRDEIRCNGTIANMKY